MPRWQARVQAGGRKDSEYWFFLRYDMAQKLSQRQLLVALIGAVLVFCVLSLLHRTMAVVAS